MNRRMVIRVMALALMVGGIALVMGGCRGIPVGTMKTTTVGTLTIRASGAGIVSADAAKTVYKIRCAVCGFEAATMTVDTPVAGKPYTLTWVCPDCGHKQKIVIEVVSP